MDEDKRLPRQVFYARRGQRFRSVDSAVKVGSPIPGLCDHPRVLFLRVQAGIASGLMRMGKLK